MQLFNENLKKDEENTQNSFENNDLGLLKYLITIQENKQVTN